MLLSGLYNVKKFYWARVAGNYSYNEGIDFFFPRLQMNPPNVSVLLYSAGMIWVCWWIFRNCELIKEKLPFIIKSIVRILNVLGKYSLDIFIWHLFISDIMKNYLLHYLSNIWIRRAVFYSFMFFLPVMIRSLYNGAKNKMYIFLSHNNE